MYKSRIRKWQIDKKRKRHEMLFALKLINKRRQKGKSTQITIRGQNLAGEDVRKYFKRQKSSIGSDAAEAENVQTPSEVFYGTPVLRSLPITVHSTQRADVKLVNETSYDAAEITASNMEFACTTINASGSCENNMAPIEPVWPVYRDQAEIRAIRSRSPVPRTAQNNDKNFQALWGATASDMPLSSAHGGYFWQSPSPGTDFSPHPYIFPTAGICESTLHNIRDYLNLYYFNSDKWLPHMGKVLGLRKFDFERYEGSMGMHDPRLVASFIEVAVQLFDQGDARGAGFLVNSVCAIIKSLVNEQHPQLLSTLLVAASILNTTKYKEIYQVVLRQFYDIADILFGAQHPFTQLTSLLSKASAQSFDVSERGLRLLRDGYVQHAGQYHPESLNATYTDAWGLIRRGKTTEAEVVLKNLQKPYESKTGSLSRESRKVLASLAQIHIQRGNVASAKCLLEENYRRMMQLDTTHTITQEKVENLRVRALLCKKRHEFAEMQVLLNEAWTLGTESLPADHITMLLLAHDLSVGV